MSFQLVHNDLTKMETDAIVNAANSHLQMGGGVCGAIFAAARSKALQEECDFIGTCSVGNAVITKGYNLPAKYVIHAVGPVWQGGNAGESGYLASAYEKSLRLAKDYGLKSIAMPLISSGIYGYPKEEALHIAVTTIREFLLYDEMDVYLVVFDRKAVALSQELNEELTHYIDTYYEEERIFSNGEEDFIQLYSQEMLEPLEDVLEELVIELEESFSEMLFRLIDEKGKTDVEVYKKANIDRKLFSKIRSKKDYQPKKSTVLALAISLELSVDETEELLEKAGYALSMSHKFDVIVRYFIDKKKYDLFVINEALFCYEQKLLGT